MLNHSAGDASMHMSSSLQPVLMSKTPDGRNDKKTATSKLSRNEPATTSCEEILMMVHADKGTAHCT